MRAHGPWRFGVSCFIFSVVALVLTIYGLNTWTSFYEQNIWASVLFRQFGVICGSLIILLLNFSLIGIFVFSLRISKSVAKGKLLNDSLLLFIWSLIDSLGFAQLKDLS